jgi:hypothetical protein
VANAGTITVNAPTLLQGQLTNTGTLTLNQSTTYNLNSATLTNQKTVTIASGQTLTLTNGAKFTNAAGAALSGTGTLSMVNGTFTQASTKAVGPIVIMDDGVLTYTGTGAGNVHLRGSDVLTANVPSGLKLQIESTCAEHATVSKSGNLTNAGTITLTNLDSCADNASLVLSGATLTNKGTLQALEAAGGQRLIDGSVSNAKTILVDAAANLHVTGTYMQTATGTFTPTIHSASSFGVLTAAGPISVNGILKLSVLSTYKATVGQTFPIIVSSASLTGTFSKETSGIVKTGVYYAPTYSAVAVTLVVKQATTTLSKASGAPGSSVTVSGTNWLAGDPIAITFTDVAHVKTTYATVNADSAGNFGTSITIPASAAAGKGSIAAKSGITAVSLTKTFAVGSGASPVLTTTAMTPAQRPAPGASTGRSTSAPIANAGMNQSARVGAVVTLDGSGSLDADGHPLAFEWSLVSAPAGVKVAFDAPSTVINPAFRVIAPGAYVFQLVVSDGIMTSAPDIVTVSTADAAPVAKVGQSRTDGDSTNGPPVADAGANQSVFAGATVALDAQASSDPDDDVLSFEWALLSTPVGSRAALSTPDGMLSSFAADVAGSYTIQLTATDGRLSNSVTIIVVAIDPAMPTAAEIQAVIANINSLPASVFVDNTEPRALTGTLDAVRRHVASQDFKTALAILEDNVFARTDGCAVSSAPDGNDVVTACQAQNQISANLMLLRTQLIGLAGGR